MEKSISITEGKSMIKKISIDNFRSHKNTELEFCEGVNCIIGLPDSGKTNIIRALNWVLTNRPRGFRFHSDFTKEPTIVAIEFDEGKIALAKTKAKSIYMHNDIELQSIGSDVPDVIQKQANMTELNSQFQMDNPFLICETPGEVAKVFNKISNLEKPDEAIASITTDINSTNKEIRSLILKQEQLQDDLKKYDNLVQMKKDLKEIQSLNKEYVYLEKNIYSLESLIESFNQISNILKQSIDFNKADKDLRDIEKLHENIYGIEAKVDAISEVVDSLQTYQKEIDNIKQKYKVAQNEYADFLKTIEVCPYCEACKEPISKHNLDKLIKKELI